MPDSTMLQRTEPFQSVSELRAEHISLLEKLNKQLAQGASAENEAAALAQLEPQISQFLYRGEATGIYLEEVEDRTMCQVLLDYWVSSLSRAGIQVSGVRLAHFDEEKLPILTVACPYVGLEAFRDKTYFFGRESGTSELLEKVRDLPLVVVVGASGSGKSSIVMGGLLPAIREKDATPKLIIVPDFVPGNTVLDNLVHVIRPTAAPGTVGEDVALLRQDPGHLRTMLGGQNALPTLITIDQFEEVFTLSDPSDRDALVANLGNLLRADPRHRVILTVRQEFKDRMVELRALASYLGEKAWYGMPPMIDKELKAAVERPAALVNLQFQPGIVEDLVNKVLGQPTALPLLQFTLQSLWAKRKRNRITWEVYKEVGDPKTALEASADKFYNDLAERDDQEEVKRILLELVRVDEMLEVYRQPVPKQLLLKPGKANTQKVLDLLEKNLFVRITPDSSDGDAVVEVKHESLVRNWPKYVEWIKEKRDEHKERLALTQAAERWKESNRPPEGLLTYWQLENARSQSGLSELEDEFVEASAAALDRKQREKEAALRDEAERAQATARKLRRRFNYAVTGFLLALVAAGVAFAVGRVAYVQNRKLLEYDRKQITMENQRLKLQKENAQMLLEQTKLEDEKMRLALQAEKMKREEATKLLETADYTSTYGQIEEFRRRSASLDQWGKTTHARNAFGSVASYLWSKGDDNSLDKLVDMLKNSADLIPEDYATERLQGFAMPFVSEKAEWPLTIRYSPARNFDQGQLLYQWRSMATFLASKWGIPAPMRIKLIEDDKIGVNDILIIADSGLEDKEPKSRQRTKTLVTQRGQVLISTALPKTLTHGAERLDSFIARNKMDWIELKEIKDGGPWYLVPRWTQPLWQVAGRDCFPIEEAVALLVADTLVKQPELVLTPECVNFLLERMKDSHPDTVHEVLLARGGPKGVAADLAEMVREGQSLVRLEYLLDALAKYPKTTFSSDEAALSAIDDQSQSREQLPERLPGFQARAFAGSAEERFDSLPAPQVRRLEAPADEKLLKKSYRQAYEEANPWLPSIEPPIRVYLGDPIAGRFVTPADELMPELMKSLRALREDVHTQFGISIPGVHFREPEGESQKKALRDAFRIEMLNQADVDEDAKPIKATSDRAVKDFLNELRWRCIALRTWWLTAERASEMKDDLSQYLRDWLEDQYTLTDLKLILRAVILPDEKELVLYQDGAREKAFSEIQPEQSLDHLPWLLGSLVFWTSVTDPLNATELTRYLRETQRARLNPGPGEPTDDRVAELIKRGIEQYNKERIKEAKSFFDSAVKLNRPVAYRTFLSLYSRDSQIKLVEGLRRAELLCSLPAPGEIATAKKPDTKDLDEAEEFLKGFGSQISPERLREIQLWLLWSYADEKEAKEVGEVGERLLAEKDLKDLTADRSYLLGYLMLRAHGELMVPPENLRQVRGLLLSAFQNFEDEEAERAFAELISTLYARGRATPIWYVSLLSSLAEFHPQSFWIPYRLGAYLASRRYSQKELEAALVLQDRAQANLPKTGLEDQTRLRAWLDYSKAESYLNLSEYRNPQDRRLLLNQALDLLVGLKDRVKAAKGWPQLDSIQFRVSLVYLGLEKIDEANNEVARGLERFPDSEELQILRYFLVLATGNVGEASKLARDRLAKLTQKDEAYQTWLSYATMLQVLTGEGDFNGQARRYLEASYDDQDYVRMVLYWALCKQHREDEAKELLAKRWSALKPSDWPARLEQGDKKVWNEMLVAYYAGKIGREEVFGPLENRGTFEKSKLTTVGETFLGFQCDYFYDALFQDVSGNSADRQRRMLKSLEKVVASRQLNYFEYHMARYFISRQGHQPRKD